jgi:hypothetical protein
MRTAVAANRRSQRATDTGGAGSARLVAADTLGVVQADEVLAPVALARPPPVGAVPAAALAGAQRNELNGKGQRGCKVFRCSYGITSFAC